MLDQDKVLYLKKSASTSDILSFYTSVGLNLREAKSYAKEIDGNALPQDQLMPKQKYQVPNEFCLRTE